MAVVVNTALAKSKPGEGGTVVVMGWVWGVWGDWGATVMLSMVESSLGSGSITDTVTESVTVVLVSLVVSIG